MLAGGPAQKNRMQKTNVRLFIFKVLKCAKKLKIISFM